jgi:uncharacterized protein (DUF1697 family)
MVSAGTSRYAAFLRGMNVGGHRVKSEELRSLFEALGFTDVRVFRASGNIVFTAEREPVTELTARSEAGLEEALGYAVPTFLRTAEEVRAIAAAQPFDPPLVQASKGKLQVTMLSSVPAKRAREDVLALPTGEDLLTLKGRELYWLPSGGILDSVLDLKAIAKLLGAGTTRTKNTVEQIAAKHFAD